jgi:hypothetical protein
VVSFGPWQVHPQGHTPWYPLDKRLGGLESRCGRCGEKECLLSLPGIEPRYLSGLVCILVGVQSELFRFHYFNVYGHIINTAVRSKISIIRLTQLLGDMYLEIKRDQWRIREW